MQPSVMPLAPCVQNFGAMSTKQKDTHKHARRLRTLTSDDLRVVTGGTKGKPGEFTSSSGGGGIH